QRAGYSGTPLAQKLGIKPGSAVALINAPMKFEETLEGLPGDASVARDPRRAGPFQVMVVFCESSRELSRRFPQAAERLGTAGGLWTAGPKKASGIATDLTEDVVRKAGLLAGLVDNKVCAIDQTWSGLRFVYRLKDRPR